MCPHVMPHFCLCFTHPPTGQKEHWNGCQDGPDATKYGCPQSGPWVQQYRHTPWALPHPHDSTTIRPSMDTWHACQQVHRMTSTGADACHTRQTDACHIFQHIHMSARPAHAAMHMASAHSHAA